MKRGLILLVVLFAGLGTFLYSTNSDFKAELNSWIGIAQQDSVQENSQVDTVSNATRSTNKTSKRKKIPKTIKPDKYAHLDRYARETPDKYSRNNSELAEYLKRPAKSDLEKARLIYSWIVTHIHYDDEGFNTGQYKDEIADSVLVRRKAVCEGFSSLFQELGLLMGLEVEKISGYAKGYSYHSGDKFLDSNHAWNAVKINDIWQLIDVTWGSSESETTDKGLKSTMRFDPYWFCVQPDAFIFSHLPENKDWQLTGSVVTMKQYEEMPFLSDSFFKIGFNSKEILKKVLSGEAKEFIETYSLDYPIRAIELPFTKKIVRGNEYNFSFESEYLENVVIIDDGQWINLKREGNVFKIKHTPKGDKLQIAVKVNWFDDEYSTIVVYETVDEKNLTAHNKMFAQWCVDV
jgi:Transglutaminase-like superfamily